MNIEKLTFIMLMKLFDLGLISNDVIGNKLLKGEISTMKGLESIYDLTLSPKLFEGASSSSSKVSTISNQEAVMI